MKKIIFLLIPILLTSCFSSSNKEEVEKAKSEILGNETTLENMEEKNETTHSESGDESIVSEVIEDNGPKIEITNLSSSEPVIEIDDLAGKDLYSGEAWITGTTMGNVDKIEVAFSNATSSYPPDLYRLKEFSSGATNFKYLASTHYQTLDFGVNEYIFTAYSGKEIYKVKVVINLPEKKIENNNVVQNENSTTDESFESTDIKDFVIKNESVSDIKCDNLTEYLTQKYTYSYWNTCRDIIKDSSIGFYVLRLYGDNYLYEKHYIDYEKGLYGILLLEKGNGVTKSDLQEKNAELKIKTWDSVLSADRYFIKMQ